MADRNDQEDRIWSKYSIPHFLKFILNFGADSFKSHFDWNMIVILF